MTVWINRIKDTIELVNNKEKEWQINIQEVKLNEREKDLKIRLLEQEREKQRQEVILLQKQMKDQNETNMIKLVKLQEKLRNIEENETKEK